MTPEAGSGESALKAWVEAVTGRRARRLDRVGYGSSRATYTVEMDEPPDLVIRRDTGDGPMAGTELSLAREAEVYRALGGTGVRIPALHAVAGDGRALLVTRAEGTHDLSDLSDEDLAAVLDDYIDALAGLHRVDPATLDLPSYRRPADGRGHATEEIDAWERILLSRTRRPWPLAHYSVRFLRDHAPDRVQRTVVCHGDVGPGNFVHDGRRVTAMLDWEFSHVGDPMDDLGWWVFRGHDMAGRCGDLGGQLRRWSAGTGLAVDARRVDYYRIMVMLRWLISVAAALDAAGAGMDRSVYFSLVPILSVRLPAAMAEFAGVALGPPPDLPADTAGPAAEVLDALDGDLRDVIAPDVTGSEPKRRLAAAGLYLSHLRAVDARGPALERADLDDLADLLGRRPPDPGRGEAELAALVGGGPLRLDALPYLWRHGRRQVALWPAAEARALRPATQVEGAVPA